jgi:hypothetical protein
MSDYLADRLRAQSAAAAAERARRLNRRHAFLESGLVAAGLVLAVIAGALASYVIADYAASGDNPTVLARLAQGGDGAFPTFQTPARPGDLAEIDASATGSIKPLAPADAGN